MGSTTNRAIPYVEPADALAGYPTQDKAQADRLDELLYDTGWVDITIAAGFAASSDKPQLRRVGSVIHGRGAWSSTGLSANTNHVAGTIPAGYAPPAGTSVVIAAGSASSSTAYPVTVLFSSNSQILIRTGATIGSWVYINALTYFLS